MNKKSVACWASLALCVFFLYFFRLTAIGLVSTDEPRYAAIGRAMALSGNWITPVLWGRPWFEKPPLLYWMTAGASLAGLGPDWAPRLPVALAGVAFLLFFYVSLRHEIGARAALYAALVLASSAGWIVYSRVAVTDLPLAATFSAAVLLALPWLKGRGARHLPAAAAFLGVAVLAKGLVPLVLILPLLYFGRKQWRDLAKPRVWAVFLLVAAPWYTLCFWRNGPIFLEIFFIKHTFGRFTSPELQHGEPFWFYGPALAGMMFPWVTLLPLLVSRSLYRDRAMQALLGIILFGFVFFSLSTNKLPGYLLPLLPPLAALLGVALDFSVFPAFYLLAATVTLAIVPVAAWSLPIALATGLRHAYPVELIVRARAALLMPFLLIAGMLQAYLDRAGKRTAAVAIVFGFVTIAVVALEIWTLPVIDSQVSARHTWRAVSAQTPRPVCLGEMSRAWRYGLNYYAGRELPTCQSARPSTEIRQAGGRLEVHVP